MSPSRTASLRRATTRRRTPRRPALVAALCAATLALTGLAAAPPAEVPTAAALPYQDPSLPVPERVADLLSRMTLDDKLGQMTQIEKDALVPQSDLATYRIGSVLSGGDSTVSPNNAQTWADTYDSLQRTALGTPLGIPMIYGIDAVHGHNAVRGATVFPHNIGLGATRDPALVQRVGRAVAEEVAGTGIDWSFAPCLCVARNDRWGRTYESFGEKPEQPTLGLALLGQGSAQGHGVAMMPGSRTYLCYLDAKTSTGSLDPTNPACKAALAESGATALYNWFAVLDSNVGGRGPGHVPDGELCSAGDRSPYNFTGYNAARADWPRTHLTSGKSMQVRYSNWAAHPGDFRVYLSKPGYSPSTELGWDDLELIQTVTNPAQSGSPGSESGHYSWNLNLPSGRSGDAVLFIQWVRSDSRENFFSCSDIVFDGGNGEVTGIRDSGGTPTPPTPTDPHTGCMAVYSVTNSWSGGFQGSVEVMNHNTAPLSGWAVRWQPGEGTRLDSVWNGALSTGSDGTVTVRNVDHNRTIAPDGSVSFGFTATGNNVPVGSIGCVNP